MANYFWQIMSNSEPYSEEILDRCVTKFSEMVKYSSMAMKKPFFGKLAEFMRRSTNERPTIPLLRLFQSIVKVQKDRERVMQQNAKNYGNVGNKWVTTGDVPTLPSEVRQVFDQLETEMQFSEQILFNLQTYF